MTSQDFVRLALQIATMLAFGLAFGQVMRRFRQPAVLGEMIGGIVLGPTIFGLALPGLYLWLFQSSPNAAVVRDASIKLGMLFFLFVAGLEIDFSQMRQIGRKALLIGSVGTLVPIAAGVGLVYAIPRDFWGPAGAGTLLCVRIVHRHEPRQLGQPGARPDLDGPGSPEGDQSGTCRWPPRSSTT